LQNDAPVNVSINQVPTFDTIAAGEASSYVPVTAGTLTLRITSINDDTTLAAPLDIAAADGNRYTLLLTEQAHAFVLDETNVLRSALLQTTSAVLILNATDEPLDIFYGTLSASLPPDAAAAGDMPTTATVFSVFSNGQVVLQEPLVGVPNNYTLLVITRSANTYQIVRAHYSSLNATEFLRGLGIGGANGLNLALAAFENANLLDELTDMTPLTIFAPINSAVDAVPEDTLDAWLESRVLLENVMSYHVAQGEFSTFDTLFALNTGESPTLTTLQGEALSFMLADDGTLMVNGAQFVGDAYRVRNGVIYAIDTLLQPSVLPEVTVLP
jgi:uncharacterized surface protein with fasciclin (FAS1) repeats